MIQREKKTAITQVVRANQKALISITILIGLLTLSTLATAKCHLSWESGLHCHGTEAAPHLHPFADH